MKVLGIKKIVFTAVLLAQGLALAAQQNSAGQEEQHPTQQEQLLAFTLMSLAIIGLLVGMLIYRHKKNRRLKEQFLQLQEARRSTEASQAIRRAFVSTIQEKLNSPISVLMNYARIFNNPNFLLKPEERPKRYKDILAAAQTIESLMDPVLDSYAQGVTGLTSGEKDICTKTLRTPLTTLINTAELVIDVGEQMPHDEYMQLRGIVCRKAYHVATSTHQLILFSLYGDGEDIDKPDRVGLNELARSILNSFDLHPTSVGEHHTLTTEFQTEVADDIVVSTSPLLQEALNCLLNNAAKYATGGAVLMNCYAEGDGTYAISVSNEGPAIPAADAERIFSPFVRLSATELSLGLGLPLARRLADGMGYRLVLDLEHTGGVRFVVSGLQP